MGLSTECAKITVMAHWGDLIVIYMPTYTCLQAADGGQDLALTYLGSTLCRMGQQQRGFEIYQQAIARKEPTAFSFLGRVSKDI